MTDPNTNHPRGADDPLAVAQDLLRRGIMPLPLTPAAKNHVIRGWQNLTITTANVTRFFNGADLNIGGRMGEKSGGLRRRPRLRRGHDARDIFPSANRGNVRSPQQAKVPLAVSLRRRRTERSDPV